MSKPGPSRLARRAVLAGGAAVIATPAYAQFGDLFKKSDTASTAAANPAAGAGVQNLQPRGYSQRFLPVRDYVVKGQYDDALKLFQPPPDTKADPKAKSTAIVSDPFLLNMEAGLLELENGGPDRALARFKAAEDSATADAAKDNDTVSDKLGSAAGWIFGKATGQEEIEAYHALDHERILQLNYMTLAFLLQGDRHCYNVTRGCIQEQGQLKAKFDKEIDEYKAKYEKQQADQKKLDDQRAASAASTTAGATPASTAAGTAAGNGTSGQLSDQFKAYDQLATRVPNAYVNPLADYLAGVIQEVVSSEQPALRDNSRIAYADAAKLCGNAPQLLSAAKAMARPRIPKGERVLHVIAGEGFAPARQVLTYGFAIGSQVMPVRVPIFTPVPSKIARIVVRGAKGAVLAECDPIGDFEAIRLRDQHDRQPEIMLSVMSSIMASYGTGQLTKSLGIFGLFVQAVRETTASPDTRSWLSLPRRFHAARLVLPAKIKSVDIVAYDDAHREISAKPVDLSSAGPQSLVYARATDEGLSVQAARKLWIDGRLEVL